VVRHGDEARVLDGVPAACTAIPEARAGAAAAFDTDSSPAPVPMVASGTSERKARHTDDLNRRARRHPLEGAARPCRAAPSVAGIESDFLTDALLTSTSWPRDAGVPATS
jgi:hypothetical protein